jgi:predicted HTH transcriptional regulator
MGMFIVRFRPGSTKDGATLIPVPDFSQLSERQQKAMEYVLEHGSITGRQFEQIAGLSRTQSRRDLAALVAGRWLMRIGANKASRYVLIPFSQQHPHGEA